MGLYEFQGTKIIVYFINEHVYKMCNVMHLMYMHIFRWYKLKNKHKKTAQTTEIALWLEINVSEKI